MKPEITDAVVEQIIDKVDLTKLGEWEQKFMLSIRDWWKKNKRLSDKQRKRLGEIWEKQSRPKA